MYLNLKHRKHKPNTMFRWTFSWRKLLLKSTVHYSLSQDRQYIHVERCYTCESASPATNTTHQKLTSLLPFPQTTWGLRGGVASWQQREARGSHRGSHWSTPQTSLGSCTGASLGVSPEHGAAQPWTWTTGPQHWSTHANSYFRGNSLHRIQELTQFNTQSVIQMQLAACSICKHSGHTE